MVHTKENYNSKSRDSIYSDTARLHYNRNIAGVAVIENKELIEKVENVLMKSDKSKITLPGYNDGFTDCLRLICEIYNLQE